MSKVVRNKGSINFRLKKTKRVEHSIYMDFSNGKDFRLKYSIGYSVDPKYWDVNKQRVKNVAVIRNSNEINDLMRDLETATNDFITKSDSSQTPFTRDNLRAHLDAFTNKISTASETVGDKTLLGFIDDHIKRKEKQLPASSTRKENPTVSTYKQTQKHLVEFVKSTGFDLNFENIDEEFYSEFLEYMKNKTYGKKNDKRYSINTIGKQIKNFIGFMNAALYDELHTNYKFKKFKIPKEQTVAIYLTMEELKSLLDVKLAESHLILARDIFLIGCEIGQRISDYHDLSYHQIVTIGSDEYIKIKQQKTGKEVHCLITEVVRHIMDKRYSGKLPPAMSTQKINDYIKIVGEKAGVNSIVRTEQTIGGKKVIDKTKKYNLLQGHTARRTFCTLKYKSGMDVNHIMLLSGHTTSKEFLKYIRAPKEELVAQITSSKEFLSSSISVN